MNITSHNVWLLLVLPGARGQGEYFCKENPPLARGQGAYWRPTFKFASLHPLHCADYTCPPNKSNLLLFMFKMHPGLFSPLSLVSFKRVLDKHCLCLCPCACALPLKILSLLCDSSSALGDFTLFPCDNVNDQLYLVAFTKRSQLQRTF